MQRTRLCVLWSIFRVWCLRLVSPVFSDYVFDCWGGGRGGRRTSNTNAIWTTNILNIHIQYIKYVENSKTEKNNHTRIDLCPYIHFSSIFHPYPNPFCCPNSRRVLERDSPKCVFCINPIRVVAFVFQNVCSRYIVKHLRRAGHTHVPTQSTVRDVAMLGDVLPEFGNEFVYLGLGSIVYAEPNVEWTLCKLYRGQNGHATLIWIEWYIQQTRIRDTADPFPICMRMDYPAMFFFLFCLCPWREWRSANRASERASLTR